MPGKMHEKFLYEIWKEQNFSKELITHSGDKVEIIDPGIENEEFGGPDFKHARIKIGNLTYYGDIEIDSFHSDWRAHGHNINKKYNSVILHAIFKNEPDNNFVYTQNGRKIPSLAIDRFLKDDIRSNVQKAILSERKKRMYHLPCIELNKSVDEKMKLDFLYHLGLERFKFKCTRLYERLKEISYLKEMNIKEPVVHYEPDKNFFEKKFSKKDFSSPEIWQQIFYESIFEALGYTKNKDIMRKLSIAADLNFIKSFSGNDNYERYLESIFFNVSGLMPDVYNLPDEETSEYTKELAVIWNEIKNGYDSQVFHPAQWHFYKLRPQNFPTIRIAGGVKILNKMIKHNLMSSIVNKVQRSTDIKRLADELRSQFIIKGEGFWYNHYVFDNPAKVSINYFVGYSRANDIIVNIIIPLLLIYFEIFNKNEEAKKIQLLYVNFYQDNENKLVAEVSETLNLNDAWKRSVLHQGMINLFRNYCSKSRCLECKIGEAVFN